MLSRIRDMLGFFFLSAKTRNSVYNALRYYEQAIQIEKELKKNIDREMARMAVNLEQPTEKGYLQ